MGWVLSLPLVAARALSLKAERCFLRQANRLPYSPAVPAAPIATLGAKETCFSLGCSRPEQLDLRYEVVGSRSRMSSAGGHSLLGGSDATTEDIEHTPWDVCCSDDRIDGTTALLGCEDSKNWSNSPVVWYLWWKHLVRTGVPRLFGHCRLVRQIGRAHV